MHKDQLSQAQRRLWLLDQLHPGKPLLNGSLALRIHGWLDVEALSWAVTEIGRRHDALRSEILVHDDQPYQLTKSLELRLRAEDYSPLSPAEREQLLRQRLEQEIKKPFDHSRAPLLRCFLFRESPLQHVLLLVASQVILDPWSFDLVWRDLKRVYEARHLDRELPSSRRTRFQVESGQQKVEARGLRAHPASLDYWQKELDGMPVALELGADHQRPRLPSFRAARNGLRLEPQQLATLRELCGQRGLPASSVALAALELVLARYSAQDDFGIGVNTRFAHSAERVGMFARTLALRSDVRTDLTFGELLERVHARYERGRQHDDAPARELAVAFQCQEARPQDFAIEGLRLERLDTFTGCGSSELLFCLRDEGNAVELGLDSATDLFEAETAARLCRSWLSVLAAAVRNPELGLDELPVIAPADEHHLLDTLNDTGANWDERALVHRLFEAQVDAQPDAVALVFEERCLTFAELDVRANRLAQLLASRGVGPDTLVGLSLRRTPDLVVAMLAILKAGGSYVPLDPDYPPERIEYVLADSQAKLLLTSSDIAERLSAKPECVTIDHDAVAIAQAPGERLRREERPSQLCYVIYTSGSTGKPKGVMVEHRNATSFFAGMRSAIELDGRGVWLAATSISFDISVLEILGCLSHGRRVVLLGEAVLGQVADPRYGIAAQIERHGVTHFQCTPSQARILLLDDAGRAALASLRQLLVGGEALSQELAAELSGLVRGKVFNMYGPTETTVWSTTSLVERGARVSIGRPIANTCLFVLDARGRVVPAGAVGELYIGGPGVTRGYHGRPELSRERFVNNELRPDLGARLYRTGDLVRYAADGTLLYLGRNDHQVKIRGHRIELGEIESVIRKAEGIRDVAVVARGSADNQRLVAYIVSEPAFRGEEPLRALLRDTLPDFMMPAAFVKLGSLPLTPNGKIDRNALPEPAASNLTVSEYVAPRGEREHKLSEIWQRALGVPRVGRCDNFFDLGGHSLLAVKISNEVERTFGVRLPLATLFECPTLEAFAARLSALDGGQDGGVAPPWTTLVPIQPKGSLPPLFCVAGVGGNPMNLFHLASALGGEQPFYGLQMRGVDGGLTPHRNVRAMAEEFLADVRTQQAEGPYYLAGYSFGGLVALEMASLLREAGESVGLVVLFDTMNPLNPSWTLRERIGAHLSNLRERGVAYFANRLIARAQAELVRRRRKLYAQLARVRHFEYRNEAVWEAAEEAMARYEPRVYVGDVLLLQADWRLTAGDGIGLRPHESNGWGDLLPALQIVEIPSSHVDVVSEQASPLAAAALTRALATVREHPANGRAPPASTPPASDADADGFVRVA